MYEENRCLKNEELISISLFVKRKLTTQHFQEKRREMQVRSVNDTYLHFNRSARNCAAL